MSWVGWDGGGQEVMGNRADRDGWTFRLVCLVAAQRGGRRGRGWGSGRIVSWNGRRKNNKRGEICTSRPRRHQSSVESLHAVTGK